MNLPENIVKVLTLISVEGKETGNDVASILHLSLANV